MYSATPQFDGEGAGLQPSAAVSANAAASPVTAYNDEQSKMAGYRAANASVAKPLAPSSLAAQESGAIGATSMASQSGAYKEPGKGAGMSAAKAPKKIDKSNWDRSTKVSPSTVASVKSAGAGNMGYGAARNAKYGMTGYYGSELVQNKPASNEYKEATKRVYPSAYKSVTTPFKPVAGTAGGGKYVGSTFVPNAKKSGSGGGSPSAVK